MVASRLMCGGAFGKRCWRSRHGTNRLNGYGGSVSNSSEAKRGSAAESWYQFKQTECIFDHVPTDDQIVEFAESYAMSVQPRWIEALSSVQKTLRVLADNKEISPAVRLWLSHQADEIGRLLPHGPNQEKK